MKRVKIKQLLSTEQHIKNIYFQHLNTSNRRKQQQKIEGHHYRVDIGSMCANIVTECAKPVT